MPIWPQDEQSSGQAHQNLISLYRGYNWVQSRVQSDGLRNTLLSEGCILENTPMEGRVDKMSVPRTGEGMRSLSGVGSSCQVHQGSCPLEDLLLHLNPLHLQFIIHFLQAAGPTHLVLSQNPALSPSQTSQYVNVSLRALLHIREGKDHIYPIHPCIPSLSRWLAPSRCSINVRWIQGSRSEITPKTYLKFNLIHSTFNL